MAESIAADLLELFVIIIIHFVIIIILFVIIIIFQDIVPDPIAWPLAFFCEFQYEDLSIVIIIPAQHQQPMVKD